MKSTTDRFIVAAQPEEHNLQLGKAFSSQDFHRMRLEVGPSWNFMNSIMVPGVDIMVAGRDIREIGPDFKSFMRPHTHAVNEGYVIIGGLTIEMILDDEKHEVHGPSAVFIPAGMMHTYRPLKGKGWLLTIDRSGEHEVSHAIH